MQEYRKIFNDKSDDAYAEGLIARCAGLDEDISQFGYVDYKAVQNKFFEIARNPLDDPNSVSESG